MTMKMRMTAILTKGEAGIKGTIKLVEQPKVSHISKLIYSGFNLFLHFRIS